jgi:hypothetical protein
MFKQLSYIFDQDPDLGPRLFPSIHRHGEAWRESREFRSQALRFVQVSFPLKFGLFHF